MKVKICGITTVDDLLLADRAGADYAGIVLADFSKRAVSLEQLRALGAATVTLKRVGVFVRASEADIAQAIRVGHLDVVQLYHCTYSGDEVEIWAATADVTGNVAHVVIDAPQAGSGQCCDWHEAAQRATTDEIVLAGGLNPDNVEAAIQAVRPWCVDCASGTEATPGKKDPQKVIDFIRKAKK